MAPRELHPVTFYGDDNTGVRNFGPKIVKVEPGEVVPPEHGQRQGTPLVDIPELQEIYLEDLTHPFDADAGPIGEQAEDDGFFDVPKEPPA